MNKNKKKLINIFNLYRNLPEGYITTLSYKELNPKYYK